MYFLLLELIFYKIIISSVGKEAACNAGDLGSIPGLGRCPGEGNGNPLQYSCLENPMDRGAWQASPWGHKSRTYLATKPTPPIQLKFYKQVEVQNLTSRLLCLQNHNL